MSLFGYVIRIVPNSWKWSIATKRIAYGLAKLAASGLSYAKAQTLMQSLGVTIDPETFQNGIALFVMAALEGFHDWARVKWPEAKWI